MSITKLALACSVAMSLCLAPAAQAEESKKPVKEKAEKAAKAKPAKPVKVTKAAAAAAAAKAAEPNEEADEPDTTGSQTIEFNCELGNKITIFKNDTDDQHIALRWKKRLHRLTRVGTTTGAQRFENKVFGLIWIGIPAKGMLLDSKLNRQLANECKNAEQIKPVAVETAAGAAPG